MEPDLPDGIGPDDVDDELRAELSALPGAVSRKVGAHLAAAGELLDENPAAAHAHAVFARSLAPRLAAVREAAGVTGYRVGQYAEALADLRAARRMTGRADLIHLMADCERGLGRPDRALALGEDPAVSRLDTETRVELLIVLAGARRDLGQLEAAALTLHVPELHKKSSADWSARLRYAYADLLAELGRVDEARRWFEAAAESDPDDLTDAQDRLADLR